MDYHLRGGESRRSRNPDSKQVESIFFIPYTEGSRLKARLTEMERKQPYERKLKFVEQMGSSVGDILVKKDIGGGACGRQDCFPCTSGDTGKCMNQGVVYQITCGTCKEKKIEVSYIGESARTPYDRGQEWITSLRRADPSNPLEAHARQEHPEEPRDFAMKILKKCNSPLLRQVTEAQLITETGEASTILNSKGEWGQNLPPRLINNTIPYNSNNDNYSNRLAEREEPEGEEQGGSQGGAPGDGGLDGAMGGDLLPTPMADESPAPPLSLGPPNSPSTTAPAPPQANPERQPILSIPLEGWTGSTPPGSTKKTFQPAGRKRNRRKQEDKEEGGRKKVKTGRQVTIKDMLDWHKIKPKVKLKDKQNDIGMLEPNMRSEQVIYEWPPDGTLRQDF